MTATPAMTVDELREKLANAAGDEPVLMYQQGYFAIGRVMKVDQGFLLVPSLEPYDGGNPSDV